jgi:arginine exporter protein ArgO
MMNELMAEVAAQTRTRARRERLSFPSLLMGGAHLAVLSAFALAQPLFDLFSKNAEFFAVRRSSPLEIVGFALAVTFLPPLAMLAVEALAGLASPSLRRALHLVFVAGLAGLIAIQLVKRA